MIHSGEGAFLGGQRRANGVEGGSNDKELAR